MSKKQWVLNVFDNQPTDRIPVGFWFHFAPEDELFSALQNPGVLQTNLQGHRAFYNAFKPDFVKLMSDGYFGYPNEALASAKTAADLYAVKPIGDQHPWIQGQAGLVKQLTLSFGEEVATFYNLFAPATYLRFLLGGIAPKGEKVLADFIVEDANAVAHALNVIAADLSALTRAVIIQGGATGIYLSVKNVQDERVSAELYRSAITPSEKTVLASAKSVSDYNILHICGYEGSRNDLTLYTDYDVKAINWAVTVEGTSLKEGKALFNGRAVIGGFGNTVESLLYTGTKEAIQAETRKLLAHAGTTGVILGADCTVPSDIDLTRLNWVRDAATL